MTVAPHKLICPHGKTYPINAVPIINKKIIVPVENRMKRLCPGLYERKKIAFEIWIYIKTKIKEAPFACIYRNNQPLLTSRIICSKLQKASSILAV